MRCWHWKEEETFSFFVCICWRAAGGCLLNTLRRGLSSSFFTRVSISSSLWFSFASPKEFINQKTFKFLLTFYCNFIIIFSFVFLPFLFSVSSRTHTHTYITQFGRGLVGGNTHDVRLICLFKTLNPHTDPLHNFLQKGFFFLLLCVFMHIWIMNFENRPWEGEREKLFKVQRRKNKQQIKGTRGRVCVCVYESREVEREGWGASHEENGHTRLG